VVNGILICRHGGDLAVAGERRPLTAPAETRPATQDRPSSGSSAVANQAVMENDDEPSCGMGNCRDLAFGSFRNSWQPTAVIGQLRGARYARRSSVTTTRGWRGVGFTALFRSAERCRSA